MLDQPRISKPHAAPAFGGLLAWLRACGLAFFLELWYGRALYRQMVATMEILDRMLTAFREGALQPTMRVIPPTAISIPRPSPPINARTGLRGRRGEAVGVARAICQTACVRVARRTCAGQWARVDYRTLRRVPHGALSHHIRVRAGIFPKIAL